jgi:hypothetical protein
LLTGAARGGSTVPIDINLAITALNTLIPITGRGWGQLLTQLRDLLQMFADGGITLPF